MKLLVDANLSWRLVKLILHDFPDSIHLDETGLSTPAKDILIWNWANENCFDNQVFTKPLDREGSHHLCQ